MLTEKQAKILVRKMFNKQDELNIHTNGNDWKTNKDLKWYRAIWTECAELIDYTNWKWWKKQDISIKDIEMELIDIWHFAMSDMMIHDNIDKCTEHTVSCFKAYFEKDDILILPSVRNKTESLAYWSIRNLSFHLEAFVKLCSSLNMDIENIYKLYMGKNILNKFRQDHGYKEKKYLKIWFSQEDNIYLMDFLKETDINEKDFETIIYDKLTQKYKTVMINENYWIEREKIVN